MSCSTGEEMKDEIICGLVVGNAREEEQLANQVNDEAKEAASKINGDKAKDVPLCERTVEVSEEVSVGGGAASNVDVPENEERIHEVAPEEDKEQMHDGVGNDNIEGGKENKSSESAEEDKEQMHDGVGNDNIEGGEERKSSESAVEGTMNIDEGLCASEHGIMEEGLTDNMQNEEANQVNDEEPVGTPTKYGQIESTDQDASVANDVKSVPEKVNKPKRKVLKRKVIKKIVVWDDAKSQSVIGNKASGEADKADTEEAVKNEEKAVTEDTSEALEDRKNSEVDMEGNMNIDEGLSASEHGVMEEMLMNKLENEEAKKVNAEEPMGSRIDNRKIECTGEDASITDETKSVPERIVIPKRKVLKKKVVKKKVLVQDDVASLEENRLGALIGDEASGEADKKNTNEDAKSKEKAVSADYGKIESTGEDASTAGNVKVDPEKANGPKRKVLKKKVVKKKVVLRDAVAPASEAKLECPIDDDASGEANKADTNKDVKNDEKPEIKPAVRAKRKRVRKKGPKGQTNIATAGGEQNSKVPNDEAGNKNNEETVGHDLKSGEAVASGVKVNNLKKRKRKKMVKEDTQKVVADGSNKPGLSEKSKSSGRTDSMGMIFMCSSETKKDCYRYKVLGLPAGKKDTVLKIYKGMRLFLFDVDQRMMYGIYKAAGPGGYNVEPRAFNRQFPSQVRFTVLKDCSPLAEEKFKTAISDNYYTKNKFSCQLTNEQVKNLCKLFTETGKAETKPVARNPRDQIPAAPSSSSHRDRKRKRVEDTRKSGRNDRRRSGVTDRRISSAELERNRRHRVHEEVRRAHEEVRRAAPIVIDDRYHHHHRPVAYDYEREPYLPPTLPTTVYQHLPSQSYSYDYEGASSRMEDIYRRADTSRVEDMYRRVDSSSLDHRRVDLPRSSREWERPVANVDIPYVPYRETNAYREPPYETTRVRREAEYENASLSVRPTEYYRVSDSYRAPLPPYRRY